MQSQTPRSSISPDRFQSSHSRWLALTHRNPSSHSSFLYGVKSTKIYCRPTCSARLARRANVEFYDTEDQARRNGFRPCKRCKPDSTTFVGEAEEVVTRTIALLRVENGEIAMRRGLKELAKEVGVTPSYLCRVFKKTIGVTIGAYMKEFEKEPSEGEAECSVQSPSIVGSEAYMEEFEREPSDGEAESSIQSPSTVGSGVVDEETGLLTPATTVRNLSVPVEGGKEGSVEEAVGKYAQEAHDLDFDFDFNEWFWNEDYLNDSIYR